MTCDGCGKERRKEGKTNLNHILEAVGDKLENHNAVKQVQWDAVGRLDVLSAPMRNIHTTGESGIGQMVGNDRGPDKYNDQHMLLELTRNVLDGAEATVGSEDDDG